MRNIADSLSEIVRYLAADTTLPRYDKRQLWDKMADAILGGDTGLEPIAGLKWEALQHYQVAPALQTATYVHAAVTLAAGATTTVTTAITNPDVPRNTTVKGNAIGIAGNVVITGTNIQNVTITDTIALSGTSEVAGAAAFKTVTSILLPARTTAGDTVSIGIGVKFGTPHIIDYAANLLVKLFDGSTDAGSLAVNAAIEKNLYTLAGTADGAKKLDLYYIA